MTSAAPNGWPIRNAEGITFAEAADRKRWRVHLTAVDFTCVVNAPAPWAAKWAAIRLWREHHDSASIRTGATVERIT